MLSSLSGSIYQEKLRQVQLKLLCSYDPGKCDLPQKLLFLRQSFLQLIKGTELLSATQSQKPEETIKWLLRMLKLFLLQLGQLNSVDIQQSEPKKLESVQIHEEEIPLAKAKVLGGVSLNQVRGMQETSFRVFKRDFGVSTDEIFLPDENQTDGPDSVDVILAIDTFFLSKNLQKFVDYRPPNNMYESLLDFHETLTKDIKKYLKTMGEADELPLDIGEKMYSAQTQAMRIKKVRAHQRITTILRKLLYVKPTINHHPIDMACQTPTRFDLKSTPPALLEQSDQLQIQYSNLLLKNAQTQKQLQHYKQQVVRLNQGILKIVRENQQWRREIKGLREQLQESRSKYVNEGAMVKKKEASEKRERRMGIMPVFQVEVAGVKNTRKEGRASVISRVSVQGPNTNISAWNNQSTSRDQSPIVTNSEIHSEIISNTEVIQKSSKKLQKPKKIITELNDKNQRKSIASIDKVVELQNINEISNIQQYEDKDTSNASVQHLLGQADRPKKINAKAIQEKLHNIIKQKVQKRSSQNTSFLKNKETRSSFAQSNAISRFKKNSQIKQNLLSRNHSNTFQSLRQPSQKFFPMTNATAQLTSNHSFSAAQVIQQVFSEKAPTKSVISSSSSGFPMDQLSDKDKDLSQREKNSTLHNTSNLTSFNNTVSNFNFDKTEYSISEKQNASLSRIVRRAVESSLPQISMPHRRDNSSFEQSRDSKDLKKVATNLTKHSKVSSTLSHFQTSQKQNKEIFPDKKKRQPLTVDTNCNIQKLDATQNTSELAQSAKYDPSKLYCQIVQNIKDSRDSTSHKVSIYSKYQTNADKSRSLRPSICMVRQVPPTIEQLIPSDLTSDYTEFLKLYPNGDLNKFVQYVFEEHRIRCGDYCNHLKRFMGKIKRPSDSKGRLSIELPKHTFQKLI